MLLLLLLPLLLLHLFCFWRRINAQEMHPPVPVWYDGLVCVFSLIWVSV
jgi:hypothetical protein